MALRRTRIKGIANIPNRRKNAEDDVRVEESNVTKVELADNPKTAVEQSGSNINEAIINWVEPKPVSKSDEPNSHSYTSIHLDKNNLIDKETNEYNSVQIDLKPVFNNHNEEYETSKPKKEVVCITKSSGDSNFGLNHENQDHLHNFTKSENSLASQKVNTCVKFPTRRKFIRPSVKIVQKKQNVSTDPKAELVPTISENTSDDFTNESTIVESEIDNSVQTKIRQNQSDECQGHVIKFNLKNENETTLNEINLAALPPPKGVVPDSQGEVDPKTTDSICIPPPSVDYEYPPPPPSPSITTNRSRIKAIPKLSYRKTSFSASESEDDTRKFNRIRNDSVCSTASISTEAPNECKPREINTIIQKKCNRTEQTRKLAEARREFQRKFNANAPDRHKLTMLDLIFYNPESNPMQKIEPNKMDQTQPSEIPENEIEDDPSNEELKMKDKSDEENDIPVPQIKIGPSGEIILDEKSLVVERKDIKKQREEIAKSQVINGDFGGSYGVYKKHKRTKFWTTDETLRFYKALNTLGTDFTLMCELFPDRTRRELKMKFNKEEKINRTLIDKALMQPCSFDLNVLKAEVELERREKAELARLKLEELQQKEERRENRFKKKRMREEKKERENYEATEQKVFNEKPSKEKETDEPKLKKARRMRRKRLDINTVLEELEDADESDIDTHSEDEVISCHKPTRSGRMPKIPRKFDVNNEMVVEKIVKKSKDEIEPGSIMIVTEEGANGEPIYKIFMITEDQQRVECSQSIDPSGIRLKTGITAKNILTISATHTDDEEVEEVRPTSPQTENNMTIPADETVTTLKSVSFPNATDERLNEEQAEVEYSVNMKEQIDLINSCVLSVRRESAISTQSVDEPPPPEDNNMTIVEDANVTSLRPNCVPIQEFESNDIILNSIKEEPEDSNSDRLIVTETIGTQTPNENYEYVILNDFSADTEKIPLNSQDAPK